ncbi:hypothetical protein LTR37_008695 [Vermiconidia calcicola]|uniref:Uncharacterized protein n=1 Tax=Vermiconidia calcicola TaxID=1690605 RepID=A0ACC3N9N5_9PEZI|nr:hypothetical protein LTR37_008695 [Vermiconidia calcicola]
MSSISMDEPRLAARTIGPPNGGTSAWLKVFGCFLIFINTYGIASSFGSYQAFYEIHGLPGYSPSAISWIGTVQVFLLGFMGILAGPLYDRGHVCLLLATGCFMLVFGFFMLSISHEFYQIMLSQGVCVGLGTGLTYVPAVSLISNTFTTKRPIANGLAASGSAVGGVLLPVIFRYLTPSIGLHWVNRIFGFMTLGISIAAVALLRPEDLHQQRHHKSFFDASALKEPSYVLLCLGLFFLELGYWIPPFMITPYARLSLGTSADFAFYLLAIMNAAGFVGRIVPAFAAQIRVIGPAWTLFVGVLSLGILVLSWLAIKSVVGLTVWCILVGFMSGITVSLPNAVVPRLSPSASVVGARTGMMWSFVSFAALIGAPIAGALVDPQTNSYKHGQMFSGISICFAAALLTVPAIQVGRKRTE